MAECIIQNCDATDDLFCAPEDKNKLRKWSNILKQTISSTDLICSRHFESRFIGTEKFLSQDAYPSIYIEQEELLDSKCSVCFVHFGSINHKHPHGLKESSRKLVENQIGIIIQGPVCFRCFDKLSDIDTFFINIAYKYSIGQTHQGPENPNFQNVDQDDDEVEILPNAPVEVIDVEMIPRPPQLTTLPITNHSSLEVTAVNKLKRKQKHSTVTDGSSLDDNLKKSSKGKKFNCSVCLKRYTTADYFRKHQLKHIADGQKDPKVKKVNA